MTASRLVRFTILVALFFLAATRLFAGPITPVVTIKTVADTSLSRIKYALLRAPFARDTTPLRTDLQKSKQAFQEKI
jgi:hypothetical protein